MPPTPSESSLSVAFDSFEARKESRKTLLGFSLIYLTGYFTDPPAVFHPQLVHSLENHADRRLCVIGFRGSGKSSFGSFALPLWAALEHPEQYPFIVLVADSSRQATRLTAASQFVRFKRSPDALPVQNALDPDRAGTALVPP